MNLGENYPRFWNVQRISYFIFSVVVFLILKFQLWKRIKSTVFAYFWLEKAERGLFPLNGRCFTCGGY